MHILGGPVMFAISLSSITESYAKKMETAMDKFQSQGLFKWDHKIVEEYKFETKGHCYTLTKC